MSNLVTPEKSNIVTADKFSFSDLFRKEDWWAIWLGFFIMAIALMGKVSGSFDLKAVKAHKWGTGDYPSLISAFDGLGSQLLFLLVFVGIITVIGMAVMRKDVKGYIVAFPVVFVLANLAYLFSQHYIIWALGIGLLISNTVGTPKWLKPAVRTEYYIKTGLVLLGAEILFSNVIKFGLYGLGIAWLVTPIVVIFMWNYGTKILKMTSKPMVIVIAMATSVCGVSAAIAAAAAAKAKKEDLTFAVLL